MDAPASLRLVVAHPGRAARTGLLWRSQLHLLATIPLAAVSAIFALVAPLLLPFSAIGLARVERARLRWLIGETLPNGHLPAASLRFGERLRLRLGESITWRETAHVLASVVAGAVLVVVVAIEIVFLGTLLGAPFVALEKPVTVGAIVMPTPLSTWPVVVSGVLCLLLFVYLNALLAVGVGCVTDGLLSAREQELAQRVGSLSTSRRVILTSFDAERRRIERDLHDGVQQRLVDSSLTLGLLQLELDDDDHRAQLLQRAQRQNSDALALLRTTILGILPPVLADHGLVAAVYDLADGSSLDVRVTVDKAVPVHARFGAEVERAAYYTVSEGLTNVLKHAEVREATVSIAAEEGRVTIAVKDDGVGGAGFEGGSGLAGLRERAEAIGGEFSVESTPAGTIVRVSLPSEGALSAEGSVPTDRSMSTDRSLPTNRSLPEGIA
jgi:signal transduction histidine kinase